MIVSLYQTVILLLFNSKTRLSFSEIKANTGIETPELCKTLQSLACGKIKAIIKAPKGRDVNATDQFEFNSGFEHALYRIVINAIQARESVQEQKATEERVFEDRQYQVDAAIVRILKTRKRCSHKDLSVELFEQCKFAMQVLWLM